MLHFSEWNLTRSVFITIDTNVNLWRACINRLVNCVFSILNLLYLSRQYCLELHKSKLLVELKLIISRSHIHCSNNFTSHSEVSWLYLTGSWQIDLI